ARAVAQGHTPPAPPPAAPPADHDDDEETRAYLDALVEGFLADFPGYGAVLADQHPDPILWIAPTGEVAVIWYHRDAFDRRETFSDVVADTLEA
ncbi:hypothetical protein, partial [Kitasatospora sp. NPDC059571]|uniref:hypothetical protein n=1 Tax=Kitasatospora sp. NPDC059571 TaxID=3346871 RepID=UPI003687FF7A